MAWKGENERHRDVQRKDAVPEPMRTSMRKELPDGKKVFESLPSLIKKHASIERHGIKVVLLAMVGYIESKEELSQLPDAKKWLKANGFMYDDHGFYWLDTKPNTIDKPHNIKVVRKAKVIEIHFDYNSELVSEIKKITGRQFNNDRNGKYWTIPASSERELKEFLARYPQNEDIQVPARTTPEGICEKCKKEEARFAFTEPERIDLCVPCAEEYVRSSDLCGFKEKFDIIPIKIPQEGSVVAQIQKFSEERARRYQPTKSPKQIKNEELVVTGDYEWCSRCGGSGRYSMNSFGSTVCYGCDGEGVVKKKREERPAFIDPRDFNKPIVMGDGTEIQKRGLRVKRRSKRRNW